MEVARSSKKIPYGVKRAEIRALTSVQGPLNHTPIIPQVEAFVNRQNEQKKLSGFFRSTIVGVATLVGVEAEVIVNVFGFVVIIVLTGGGKTIIFPMATRIILIG